MWKFKKSTEKIDYLWNCNHVMEIPGSIPSKSYSICALSVGVACNSAWAAEVYRNLWCGAGLFQCGTTCRFTLLIAGLTCDALLDTYATDELAFGLISLFTRIIVP